MKKEKKKVGKPTFYKKPMERINVMLDPETIAFYKKVGGGNLSEGIRRHWRGLTQLAPDAGDSAVSTSISQASALSTSQAESAPTQRG